MVGARHAVPLAVPQGEQAKRYHTAHIPKEPFAVVKPIEGYELAAFDQVGEEEFVRVIGGDARGDDDAGTATGAKERAHALGKNGVGVDVAAPGEGINPELRRKRLVLSAA